MGLGAEAHRQGGRPQAQLPYVSGRGNSLYPWLSPLSPLAVTLVTLGSFRVGSSDPAAFK